MRIDARRSLAVRVLGLLCGAVVATVAHATPIVPTSDAQVIEVIPGGAGRAEERRLKRELAQQPQDAKLAVQLARRYMDQARASGDPRPAGQAIAALRPWPNAGTAPLDVVLMQATVQQYLHDFDGSAKLLEVLLARDENQPQAWLTLATVRRVQGRYADSDRSCARLATLRVTLYAAACRAENDALRGKTTEARRDLGKLLAAPTLDAGTRNWLTTTLAELEERAGNVAAADAAYRAALAASDDAYTRLSYADFLIDRKRDAAALDVLRDEPRTDAVLLRLAIAGARTNAPKAAKDAAEMRERIAQANLRPEAQGVHAREQSMFALQVESQPARALELARLNVRNQREPIDLLVLAQAARAAKQPEALRSLAELQREMGLQDARLAEAE